MVITILKISSSERLCNCTVGPCGAEEDEFPGENLSFSSVFVFEKKKIHSEFKSNDDLLPQT